MIIIFVHFFQKYHRKTTFLNLKWHYFCTFFPKYHRKTSFKFRKLKFLLSLVVFIKISQKWHFLSKNCSYIWSFFIKISQKWHFLSKNCNFINFKRILTFIHKNDIFCQKITDIKVVLSILWNFIFFSNLSFS